MFFNILDRAKTGWYLTRFEIKLRINAIINLALFCCNLCLCHGRCGHHIITKHGEWWLSHQGKLLCKLQKPEINQDRRGCTVLKLQIVNGIDALLLEVSFCQISWIMGADPVAQGPLLSTIYIHAHTCIKNAEYITII